MDMSGMQPIPVPANEDVEPGPATAIIWQKLKENLERRNINWNDLVATPYTTDQELAAQWLRCTILPEDTVRTPLRYHSPANQFPSAAIGVVDFRAVKWQFQPRQENCQMGPGDMGIFTFDDNPLDIVHIYDPNPNYTPCVYNWTFNGNPVMRWNADGSLRANKAMFATDDPTNGDFHGLYLYTQYDAQNNRYFWVDGKPGTVDSAGNPLPTRFRVSFPGILQASPPTQYLFTVGLYRYYGGNPKLVQRKDINPAIDFEGGIGYIDFLMNNNDTDPSQGIFPTYSDYYTIRIAVVRGRGNNTGGPPPVTADALWTEAEAAILGGVSVTTGSICSVLRHIALKEVEVLLPQFSEKGRINALGLRVTDVPMLQYQNGLIAGFVCMNGNSWYQYLQHGLQLGDNFFNHVATANGAKVHEIWKVR